MPIYASDILCAVFSSLFYICIGIVKSVFPSLQTHTHTHTKAVWGFDPDNFVPIVQFGEN